MAPSVGGSCTISKRAFFECVGVYGYVCLMILLRVLMYKCYRILLQVGVLFAGFILYNIMLLPNLECNVFAK